MVEACRSAAPRARRPFKTIAPLEEPRSAGAVGWRDAEVATDPSYQPKVDLTMPGYRRRPLRVEAPEAVLASLA